MCAQHRAHSNYSVDVAITVTIVTFIITTTIITIIIKITITMYWSLGIRPDTFRVLFDFILATTNDTNIVLIYW